MQIEIFASITQKTKAVSKSINSELKTNTLRNYKITSSEVGCKKLCFVRNWSSLRKFTPYLHIVWCWKIMLNFY